MVGRVWCGGMPRVMVFLALAIPASLTAQAGSEVRPPESPSFVASSRGQVYYPVSCDAWGDLSRNYLIYFDTAAEAEAAGYRLTENRSCRVSEPPPVGTVGERVGPTCVVERIVDGDTLDCHGGTRVRLLLVDAPETEQDGFGLRASLALESLIPIGTAVALEMDVQAHDRYGRLLAHLHTADGTWVNRRLVRLGYAVVLVVPPNVARVEALRAAADSARAEGTGLWRSGGFRCLPSEARAGRCRRDR